MQYTIDESAAWQNAKLLATSYVEIYLKVHGCYSETGSILAWIVILSVYGADTDLLIYEINYWIFKQF
jgi:hypothetical protein